jgi:PAS domain-containing protein
MTDSKRRLAASEHKYRALFENAGDAVLLFNGDTIIDCNPMAEKIFALSREDIYLLAVGLDVNGDISFCNDYLLGLTGWQREEVIGHNWFTLFSPPDSQDADFFRKKSDAAQFRCILRTKY